MNRNLLAVVLMCASSCLAQELSPGLIGEYFHVLGLASDFPSLPADKNPNLKRVDPRIHFPWIKGEFYDTKLVDRMYVRWSGVLRVPAKGRYTIFTESDDGSRVFIDGQLVVNNYGLHAMQEEEGDCELDAGNHRLLVEYIQYDGGAGMIASWVVPGGKKEVIPESALLHDRAEEKDGVKTAAATALPPKIFVETPEPKEDATIEEKVASVLPRPGEQRWLEIKWRRNLHAARLESQVTGRPLFLWIMNGNPMGCT